MIKEAFSMKKCIKYRCGYKYQIFETCCFQVNIFPKDTVETEFIHLSIDGFLTIKKGYAWDGPSGPTWDTKNFMRGSLVHDALYQLMREKHLKEEYRKEADNELYRICREDGMSCIRAYWVWLGVRIGGRTSACPEYDRPIVVAP